MNAPWPTWLLAAATTGAAAQTEALRDPMKPPFVRAAAPAAAGSAAEAPAAPTVRHLFVSGEQRWVIDGGRRRGVGDWLGDARIERIEDSAVVVRQGGTVKRLPLFAGVVKQSTEPARR